MTDSTPLPLDSLHRVLVYIETELVLHEETKSTKRFDRVYEDATKVREWLSSVDKREPGLTIVIHNTDGTETRIPPETTGL